MIMRFIRGIKTKKLKQFLEPTKNNVERYNGHFRKHMKKSQATMQ